MRRYPHLAGRTGTAREAAGELFETYGRAVVVVPPHRPSRRVDHADLVFTHREAKEAAVVAEVRRAHASGRPVLVGTLTVEESEGLAADVRSAGVPCAVLNAVHDEDEAAIDWLTQLGNPYTVVAVDHDGRTAIDFGVYGAPETFFIDADGRVQYRHVGPMTPEVWEREFLSRVPRGGLP